ncbi:MAG: PDZ domain-containing protein [Bacteroidales bacterium]|nr:PDZ domain-containing protein [Bacteroidales bacterium]
MKSGSKKAIKIIALVVISIALICGFGYFYLVNKLKSALTGCNLVNDQFVEVVDFEYVNNWILINVKVEGSNKVYPFIFDTGSTTIVSDSLINDLTKDDYKLFSSNNKNDTSNAFHNKLYILNGLSIGNVKFKDVGSMSLDNKKWEMLNCVSPYGILGCNVLESCCFQIDYLNKKITITDQVEKLSNYNAVKWIKYRTDKQETPIIQAVLNGNIDIDLFFDTGSSSGISLYSPSLYSQFAEKDSARIEKLTSIPSMYIRGETQAPYKSLIYKASVFVIKGLEKTDDVNIIINNTAEKNFTGIIGNRYLNQYNITLDYKNKRIGIVLNNQPFKVEDYSFGFNYFVRNDKLYVGSIFENSEIEKEGICVGDEIMSINDVKISGLPQSVLCEIYRNEYRLWENEDSIINVCIKRDSIEVKMQLKKYNLFDSIIR